MRIVILIALILPVSGFCQSWLWEISKKGLNHKSYLFGTCHDIGNWYLDSMYIVKDLINKSELVMVEKVQGTEPYETSLIGESDRKQVMVTMDLLRNLSNGQKYWNSILPDSSRKVFEKFIEKYQLGGIYLASPTDAFLTIQRYYTMDYCDNARRKTDTVFRMDHYIELLARNKSIPVIGLDDQMKSTPDNSNRIGEFEKFDDTIFVHGTVWYMKLMLENNRNSECQAIDDYIKMIPPFYLKKNRVDTVYNVVERNNYWVDFMIKHLSEKRCFIASGYQHMRFRDGLITQLRRKGYRVRPVKI